jgi:Na+-translocating ferredoxin:NAD+ oxidoreductase RnfG subunit
MFISKNIDTDRVAMMNHILPKACAADDILAKCRKEKRSPTAEEQHLIDEVEAVREMVIQVDSFDGLGQEINGQIPNWKVSDRPALQPAYEEEELKRASA